MTRKEALQEWMEGAHIPGPHILTRDEYESVMADLLPIERWIGQWANELRIYYGPDAYAAFTWVDTH